MERNDTVGGSAASGLDPREARPAGPVVTDSEPHSGFEHTLLRVAWLAILLGLAMQALLLLVGTGLFGNVPDLGSFLANLAGGVSWSVLVCAGLAVGKVISQARVPAMGLFGLLAAPLALEASRALHKGTAQALEAASGAGSNDIPVLLLASVKGIEYGCLGLAVAWIGGRVWGGGLAHATAGLAVGLVFGGVILALTFAGAPQPPATGLLLSRGLNEVLFPVGCSLILFSEGALGKRVARREDPSQSRDSGRDAHRESSKGAQSSSAPQIKETRE